jgi:transposase InsO family protein
LGISGNAVYYKPKGERPENEEAMKKMDRFYMEHPTAGARTMRQHLLDEGLHLNLKRVRRLMRKLGNTLDASESVEVLRQAIARFGTPEIINSDQGSQYTSGLWAEACGNTMKVSMDGRGRAKDNIWIERFWRTIKREYIYLNPCDNAIELRKGIEKFMQYYNTERHHQGIDNEIPERKYENNKLLIRTHEAA